MPAFLKDLKDAGIRLEHMHADQLVDADLRRKFPFVINRRQDGEPVLLSGQVVVRAMAGSDVDRPGSGLGGDEIRENELRGPIKKRMLRFEPVEVTAADLIQRLD